MTHDPRDLFGGHSPATAPAELHGRVLEAARRALLEGRQNSVTSWDLLWESRAARLAWGGAVAVLITAHLVLTSTAPARAERPTGLARQQPELNYLLQLPAVHPTAMPSFGSERREPAPRKAVAGRKG